MGKFSWIDGNTRMREDSYSMRSDSGPTNPTKRTRGATRRARASSSSRYGPSPAMIISQSWSMPATASMKCWMPLRGNMRATTRMRSLRGSPSRSSGQCPFGTIVIGLRQPSWCMSRARKREGEVMAAASWRMRCQNGHSSLWRSLKRSGL